MTFHRMLNIVLFNRKQIFIPAVISTIIFALLLYFVYPVTYSSVVTILPPSEQETGSISTLIGGSELPSFLGLGGAKGNALLNAEILKSRSASEEVIKKCGLLNFLKINNLHIAAQMLQQKIDVEVSKEGILSLTIELTTPYFGRFSAKNDSLKQLVAVVANQYVAVLDKINNEKMNQKAKNSREYIEIQITEIKQKLDSAETKLKEFQNKYKAISLPEQLTAAIENAAKLKSEIVTTEIQMNTMKYSLSEESLAMQSLEKKLDVLNDKYYQSEYGDGKNIDYLPVFSDVPEMILRFAVLTRDVKIYNEVYLFLQKQYFKEKIQENKDVSNIEVLDAAIEPEKSKSPRLIFSTFTFAIFSFLFMSLIFIYKNKKEIV
ncbi:MAG: Wzz/FepE/Etk N-terminal domain-containing protein [bacterium]